MSHYFIYRLGAKRKLGKFLESYVSREWSKPWEGNVKSKGWMSVRAAITAVMRNDSMSELLQDCIAFTGDVDTVAAMPTAGYAYALAAGSCSEEISQDIPHHLVTDLENGAYGRDYLISLDKQLMSLVDKNIS
jgi:enoyl reductase-like protein